MEWVMNTRRDCVRNTQFLSCSLCFWGEWACNVCNVHASMECLPFQRFARYERPLFVSARLSGASLDRWLRNILALSDSRWHLCYSAPARRFAFSFQLRHAPYCGAHWSQWQGRRWKRHRKRVKNNGYQRPAGNGCPCSWMINVRGRNDLPFTGVHAFFHAVCH